MKRQPGADGGNGTISMQGYGTFQTVNTVIFNAGGMVCAHVIRPPTPSLTQTRKREAGCPPICVMVESRLGLAFEPLCAMLAGRCTSAP